MGRSNQKNEGMTPIVVTPRDRKLLAWIVLIIGTLLTAGGLFGVWLQGVFFTVAFPAGANFGELRAAFVWPTLFTTLGSLVVTGALFASPLTSAWSPRRRLIVFVCFTAFVLLAATICGHFATSRAFDYWRLRGLL